MELRFVSDIELEQEKLFHKRLNNLSNELNRGKIRCSIWHGLTDHPTIVLNGQEFDKDLNIAAKVEAIYYKTFVPVPL